MRHTQHEVIRVRDDVMLQSSADDSPFIAKVAALWQDGDGTQRDFDLAVPRYSLYPI